MTSPADTNKSVLPGLCRAKSNLGIWTQGLVIFACLFPSSQARAADKPYSFTLNGRPFEPATIRLTDGDLLAPGDLFEVDHLWMVLGDERRLDLFSQPDGIQLSRPDGMRTWIGLRLPASWQLGDRVDRLRTLPPAEIALLRGLSTETWTESCRRAAKWLDWARLHLSLGQSAMKGREGLPELGSRLRSLEAQRLTSWKGLSRLDSLVSLDVLPEEEFDATSLAKMTHLRRFVTGGRRIVGVETLGRLHELEILHLGSWDTHVDLTFARSLTRLRDFNASNVSDLRPLSNAKNLEQVQVWSSTLRFLPSGSFPRLKLLDVLVSDLDDAAVRQFRERNPTTEVRHRWEDGFAEVMRHLDNVRLFDAPGCGAPPSGPAVTVTDPQEVAAFAKLLTFAKGSGGMCLCLPSTWIELFQKDRRLARLGIVCDSEVEWADWRVRADLTSESIAALSDWLARHGAPSLKNSIQSTRRRASDHELKVQRRFTGLDPRVVAALGKEDERQTLTAEEAASGPLAQALKEALPAVDERIRILLHVLGPGAGESGYDPQESTALELLKAYPAADVRAASRAVVKGSDIESILGAARFFWQTGIPVEIGEDRDFRTSLLNVLQAKPETRGMVDDFIRTWWSHLSVEDRINRISELAADADQGIRQKAMLTAGQLGEAWADSILIQRLTPRKPTAAPEDAPSRHPLSDVEVAALALGYRNSPEARKALSATADPSRGFRVARAMLDGQCGLLEESDFQTKDNVAVLQLAAVESVVRCHGAHALRWAMSYDRAQYWWEDERVVTSLRQMLIDADAPGGELLRTATSLSQLRGWFALHGEVYLRRFSRSEN